MICECAKLSWEKEYENYVAKLRQVWSPDFDAFLVLFSTSSQSDKLR